MISTKWGASAALAALLLAGCGWIGHRADRREAAARRAYRPEGQLIAVARRVHVAVRGSSPDVVLIHGANGNTRDFTFSFVETLTDRCRIIALDRAARRAGLRRPWRGHTLPPRRRP